MTIHSQIGNLNVIIQKGQKESKIWRLTLSATRIEKKCPFLLNIFFEYDMMTFLLLSILFLISKHDIKSTLIILVILFERMIRSVYTYHIVTFISETYMCVPTAISVIENKLYELDKPLDKTMIYFPTHCYKGILFQTIKINGLHS